MLNPGLYAAIDRVFGPVHIANSGRASNISTYRLDGQLREQYTPGEERYFVDCPCCGKHNRLGFSYLYATKQKSGRMRLHLVYCHACGYPDKSDERWKLWQRLNQLGGFDYADYDYGPHAPPCPPQMRKPEPPPKPVPVPEWMTCPLTEPIHGVEPCDYLRGRGFDPYKLAKRWGLTYDPSRHRLIIPIHNDQPPIQVWGYQSRCVGETETSPKYLFSPGFQKSNFLYAAHKVRKQPGPLVIAEGVTGVWRMGTNTVATFGCTISPVQSNGITRLIEVMERDFVVLFYDGDVQGEKAEKLMDQLRLAASMAKGVTCKVRQVRWHKDATNDDDPCSLTRREAWDMVATACGVNRSKLGV